MFGHIDPFWDINEIKMLRFKEDYHKDLELIERYAVAGHSKEHMKLWNFFETDVVIPELSAKIKKLFPELSNLSLAINKFTPGQYLPLHRDLYGRYRKIHNLQGTTHIRRIIVMMEDSMPGQIFQIGNTSWGNWRAGDWVDWIDESLHAVYNFSLHDRYAWQLTGVMR